MGAIATFNYPVWIKRYPEFSSVDADVVNLYFTEAQLYWVNDGSGPVQDVPTQTLLLNMLTAHIAQLNKHQEDGQTVSDLVGRIDSGSEGSVNVSATMDYPPGSAQWFIQTKYGAAFWNSPIVVAKRSMFYRRGPVRIFNPVFGGRPI